LWRDAGGSPHDASTGADRGLAHCGTQGGRGAACRVWRAAPAPRSAEPALRHRLQLARQAGEVVDNRPPSLTSHTELRLIHGAAGVDPLTPSVDYLALASDQPAGSSSAYISMTSASSVRVDDTAAAAPAPIYTKTEVNLQPQAVYTVFVLGGNASPTGVIRKER
jgi:hypothetical protein